VVRILMSKSQWWLLLCLFVSACATPHPSALDLGDSSPVDLEFQWPVYGAQLTQKFRPKKRHPYKRRHQGIDLAAPKDTPIYAVENGIVTYAGHGRSGYGRLVVVTHLDQKHKSYYAHLSRYKVERGDIVRKGDLVGLMGSSGRSTGVHLHFEIRHGERVLNPLDHLPTATSAAQQANP
jgi:murein DD-endopeptidase MepM/ murein hydrolase activator NlpD